MNLNQLKISLMFSWIAFTLTLGSAEAQMVHKDAEEVKPVALVTIIPNLPLTDSEGKQINTHDLVKQQGSVLVFYRGGWCPYCNKQLSGLAEINEEIVARGYQILAISPDNLENLPKTLDKNQLNYQIYSDSGATLITALGIGFKTPGGAKAYIAANSKGKVTEVLPVPTVLVVDKTGKVIFSHSDANYKERLSNENLLKAL
jgi:peroxiredoxin